MADYSGISLESARLLLRPYASSDTDAVYPVLCREEVSSMTMRIPYPCPREFVGEWFSYLADSRKNGISCEFGLFEKRDGSYAGNCGLASILHRHNQSEVVYFIAPEKWDRGFATEALRAVSDFAFGALRLERLAGRCFADNLPSRRVMEKTGFLFEGLARHDIYKAGKYRDVCQFGLLRSDWENAERARRAGMAQIGPFGQNALVVSSEME